MLALTLRRLLAAIPTLLAVITASFFLMHAAPGSPFQVGRRLAPDVQRNLDTRYGLDLPVWEQFARYLGGLLRGDLGPSLKYPGISVADLIAQGLPTSATLGLLALGVGVTVGLAVGIGAALGHRRWPDRASTALVLLGLCLPPFVVGPVLILVFGLRLGWLPTGGWGDPRQMVLPVAVLALPLAAAVSRLIRASLIETLASNAVRNARARGLSPARVLLRYALQPALVPLVAFLGPATAGLVTGSLVVELLFGIPGIGRAFVLSALQRDFTVVMGVVVLYSALVMALNLAADLAAGWLDPRTRAT